ncbi:hypothetical protein [Legionella sp. km772]|uniref:hypothetical protein n=1 Tax=Legionella sp. km772 TaxID=2498111 RepID=UPI000F8EE599|nr:hypothetical protein [Legionella sp. km772]RUR06127.1 hypothetical protein ELY15_13510 [Legionella sp. km772]
MRIETSNLGLQSKNQAYSLYTKTEQLQVRTGGTSGQQLNFTAAKTEIKEQRYLAGWQDFADKNPNSSLRAKANTIVQQLGQNNQLTEVQPQEANDDPLSKLPIDAKVKLLLIVLLLERLNKDPDLMKKLGFDSDALDKTKAQLLNNDKPNNSQSTNSNPSQAPVVEYQAHEALYQSESAQFSAQGEVKTADGKTINITMDLLMHKETLETNDTKARLLAATKDPLVINLDGSAAELSNQRFSFDLSSDGNNELIPKLLGNRAFLALDKNNDGIINNGKELFGAQSGNGFAELAQYDEDKNGWIDENDSIYKSLKLWINAGTDVAKLVDLKTLNIGALYTGSAQTTFHLSDKQEAQKNLGVIQATGVFLKENGEAGTIQHVDLSV